jgi:putative peptide zinc metalloprotease protein
LELRPGVWLSAQEPLARLVADQEQQVVAYLEEDEIARVTQGDRARFYSEGLEGPFMPLTLVRIDPDASRTLPDAQLSSTFGGNILVREKNGLLYPEQAVYRVTFKTTGASGQLAGHTWRGKVVIAGQWSSPGMHFLRTALGTFWRETGF